MRYKYVDMQDKYVKMQHNYLELQENCNQITIIENLKKKNQLSPKSDFQHARWYLFTLTCEINMLTWTYSC